MQPEIFDQISELRAKCQTTQLAYNQANNDVTKANERLMSVKRSLEQLRLELDNLCSRLKRTDEDLA